MRILLWIYICQVTLNFGIHVHIFIFTCMLRIDFVLLIQFIPVPRALRHQWESMNASISDTQVSWLGPQSYSMCSLRLKRPYQTAQCGKGVQSYMVIRARRTGDGRGAWNLWVGNLRWVTALHQLGSELSGGMEHMRVTRAGYCTQNTT